MAQRYEEALATRIAAERALEDSWGELEAALLAEVQAEFPEIPISDYERIDWIYPAGVLAYWGKGVAFEIGPDHGMAFEDIGGGGGPVFRWVRVYFEDDEIAYARGASFREALEALDHGDEAIRHATETLMVWPRGTPTTNNQR
jgi:hypothetical protein